MKTSTKLLLAILGIVTIALASCTTAPSPHKISNVPDSVCYNMYRGYNAVTGKVQPVYIPVKDSVFVEGDTIAVNQYGVYAPGSPRAAIIGKFKGIVDFPDDGATADEQLPIRAYEDIHSN